MANPINRGSSFPETQRRHDGGAGSERRTDSGGVMGAVSEAAGRAGDAASEALGEAKETAQQWATSAGQAAGQAWDYTSRQARRMAEGAGELAEEAYEGFTGLVRRYPIASVLVALAAGFVLAEALNLGGMDVASNVRRLSRR
jgi:hypothetical protein